MVSEQQLRALLGTSLVSLLHGDRGPLNEILKRAGRFPFGESEMKLLAWLREPFENGKSLDEIRALLEVDGGRAEDLAKLCDLIEGGRIVDAGTFQQMLGKVEASILAAEVQSMAQGLAEGSFSASEFFERANDLRTDFEAGDNAKRDFLAFEISNAPSLEPPLESSPPLVEGLLFPGFSVLAAPPKSGKTWFALALTNSLVNGVPLFGRVAQKCAVAWLQVDMARASFREYCNSLRLGMNFPEAPIPTLFDSRLNLMNEQHQHRLLARLKELKPGLVVIDSLRAAAPTLKESDSDSMVLVCRRVFVAGIRDGLGANVLLLHHAPKGGSGPRGSGELAAAADSILTMTAGESGTISVHGRGRHSPVELHFGIVDNTQHGGGILLEPRSSNGADGAVRASSDRRVEDFLRAQPVERWMTISEVQREAHVGFGLAKSELGRLRGRGLAEDDGEPERTRRWRFPPHCRLAVTSGLSDSQSLPLEVEELESWEANGGQVA